MLQYSVVSHNKGAWCTELNSTYLFRSVEIAFQYTCDLLTRITHHWSQIIDRQKKLGNSGRDFHIPSLTFDKWQALTLLSIHCNNCIDKSHAYFVPIILELESRHRRLSFDWLIQAAYHYFLFPHFQQLYPCNFDFLHQMIQMDYLFLVNNIKPDSDCHIYHINDTHSSFGCTCTCTCETASKSQTTNI